jgi:hypothetical protein
MCNSHWQTYKLLYNKGKMPNFPAILAQNKLAGAFPAIRTFFPSQLRNTGCLPPGLPGTILFSDLYF